MTNNHILKIKLAAFLDGYKTPPLNDRDAETLRDAFNDDHKLFYGDEDEYGETVNWIALVDIIPEIKNLLGDHPLDVIDNLDSDSTKLIDRIAISNVSKTPDDKSK